MEGRNEVRDVVMKHVREVLDGTDVADLDTTRSMKDYGLNSLDIVEVVSCSMRDLKVKVPRAELSKLTNLDGLIDLLYRVKNGAAAKP